ncbi:putative MATE family efflux protein [Halanaerobium saccharolyticum]|uniref:Putative MATE family efflux protein n=1 Tax=Halanaerobium saccharolyticum TaxID=43595 RepID=A0A4R7YTV8_9FIRM|nr:MATE family efflux transporter [Halanaerobium saccharolyticum]RAK10264.1 putative MATE family efflux protein [Halanaerobium saccharolyticum]TDW00476.1 putative MATE family efflux protein [Halanaerobium saccharolyticum]TDX52061.1 putative MATE family efflux protein [Halanaerobium saccharolyticum]
MKKITEAKLTEGNITTQLIKLTLPMIVGMLGMVLFNLTDTYFVGQLGADQLAALSFTFPIVLIINSFILGIGIGTTSIISKYIGGKEQNKVRRTATDSLTLGLIMTTVIILIGISTIRPLFSLLGAKGIILDYIVEYMSIWYFGSFMVVIPMIGNNIIRALGDTKVPGLIMGISAAVNIILDPILIFGYGPFPTLGISGAAIATVFARTITAITALGVLHFRENIIYFGKFEIKKAIESWKGILYIGMPNALIQMALPVSSAIITRLLASYGVNIVAGFGVATKIEFFAMSFIMALNSVMGPFIGQNLGSKLFKRVDKGFKFGELFSLLIGITITVILVVFAEPVARIFNSNPEVIDTVVKYLVIVSFTYGFQGILKINSTILNVLNKPVHAALLIFTQTFILYIPLAYLGSNLIGIGGIFGALALSYLLSGILAHKAVKKYLREYKADFI